MNSFNSCSNLKVGSQTYTLYRLDALSKQGIAVDRLPFSIRILLENLLRKENGKNVRREDIEALANWDPAKKSDREIVFTPARVILQDFTGVPCVVDLAAMRDYIKEKGGDPKKINPLEPVDLVIDHSVQVDYFASPDALKLNAAKEFERNLERYRFLRWGQRAFDNFRVVPPETGIVHQVNLEYLAQVVVAKKMGKEILAYPDTLVGTDSHTTMINGLGVLGWGVGGIEAEAAMLGQPISMLIPEVVGFKLTGRLPQGSTATDLVLTVTQMLRKKGVVGKFVEFFGPAVGTLSLADRATLANMAPEYGATVGFFPVDQETLRYLQLTSRSEHQVALVEAYCKEQGLFRTLDTPDPVFSDTLELDLGSVEPSLAGPRRPQDRVSLKEAKYSFRKSLLEMMKDLNQKLDPQRIQNWLGEGGSAQLPVQATPSPLSSPPSRGRGKGEGAKATVLLDALTQAVAVQTETERFEIKHGSVVIAAITSCTNTSNPAVIIGAGLVAKKAVERGLKVKPWVKTSLAPGSQVVMSYLQKTGLLGYLEKINFHVVGFGCTTCIGNSGPLPESVASAIKKNDLVAVAVLSGNRNFEGRINPLVRANYLASPPLVVAYAIAGTMDVDPSQDPMGWDSQARPVYLKDLWPTQREIEEAMRSVQAGLFREKYSNVFEGNKNWKEIEIPSGDAFRWDENSTYVRKPPYFKDMPPKPLPLQDIQNARVLVWLGDSVTTDHISPAGSIAKDGPAAKYLVAHGVDPKDFNSYGARRGNHEVMVRGTFANIRLRNLLVDGVEGGWTKHFPSPSPLPKGEGKGEGVMSIYDAAVKYAGQKIPLIVIAGKEYGAGSSRDWAAKGPALLGVRAVLAESFERIHRSNLIGMGVLPVEFEPGQNCQNLGLSGEEIFSIEGIARELEPGKRLTVHFSLPHPNPLPKGEGRARGKFSARCRIDTPVELAYYQHGGILQYVLRQLTTKEK